MRLPIYQLDAFTDTLFAGNPAAVVLLSEFPDDALLQSIAQENNLAETAFLAPQGEDFRLRWFTPTVEVPLCGHATLASAAVVLRSLRPNDSQVVFHTQSGALTVRRDASSYVMDLPARPVTRVPDSPDLERALGARVIELWRNDFTHLAVLESEEQVRQLQVDAGALLACGLDGCIVTAKGSGRFDIVSRFFAPGHGIDEDPVTGSAHCALLPYWAPILGKTQLMAYQASARGGVLDCSLNGDRVFLKGQAVMYLEGHINVA
ncbi:PhzF family phenazine biosynthesis protein [Alcaligenes ammonioxydans]|uniref:PhzF family phenazine biosynthesis protein n=1 Tax=Alcaligenes ammonioxydans TaxID=2582914 RepID=A0ABX8SXX2_9BURK|nr:PhzF family phenazine biosynthesis protein [Alcaligenes ammonioxydans]MCH1879919.1 PhzF family phenazine biosynthesis protein [Alcaligenes ammonioxydans]QBH19517.1 PhzF family phenazine biosynthesis protein [Alcaligenes faecalis]QXX80579.1 PhzF family phenazine biosynthesis protein [Alcaligenes ammonioxydans]HRK85175.1 PhzF family phenazine biosynthesis protein [Alcaligenes faecalis]